MNDSLSLVLERLLPDDGCPGAAGCRALEYVERRLASAGADEQRRVAEALSALEARAEREHGRSFAALEVASRDALLAELEQSAKLASGGADAAAAGLSVLCHWVAEAAYAEPSGPGEPAPLWSMIGYPHFSPSHEPSGFDFGGAQAVGDECDVVVVGAGIAGSIVAGVLAAGGERVVVLERGHDARARALVKDHLQNHRLSLYGHNTGPDLVGHPRVYVDASGRASTTLPHQGNYHNNAMCVGGGGLVYGGMAWRFQPRDFRMASAYGIPAGSSLADWPLSYQDLSPYYARAEWEAGVAGSSAPDVAAPIERGYPMPGHPGHPGRRALARGAEALGWRTRGVPLLINSVAGDDPKRRGGCVRCNACVGFACPSGAKNGSHEIWLRAALTSGNATLLTRAAVTSVLTQRSGRVVGVEYVHEAAGSLARRQLRARRVVIASGAIESARLLLASTSSREPSGLGNGSDHVGRHLQGHVYPTACALMPDEVEDGRGPGPSIAVEAFSHDNPGIIGGGLLSDDFVLLPIVAWRNHLPPRLSRFGLQNKHFMRDNYRRLLKITGPIQEVPSAASRVTLDRDVCDKFGSRVARLSGSIHPESAKAAEFLRQRAVEWLVASGAVEVWSSPMHGSSFLSAGQHQAGTCRMGNDAGQSVTDGWGRVHGHDNLYVIDASLHVTNGGANPALTVMALALRNAEAMLR